MIALIRYGTEGWWRLLTPQKFLELFEASSEDWIVYGTWLHKGIKAKLQVHLIEDKAKFARAIERKEGREASRRGWYRNLSKLSCQVLVHGPQQPFRLMLGGANR